MKVPFADPVKVSANLDNFRSLRNQIKESLSMFRIYFYCTLVDEV